MLTEDQKRLVKLGKGLEEWERSLLKKWRELPSTAMSIVTKERYTMDDSRRKREPFEFAQMLIRAAKSATMPVFSQIYLIYNGLELEFRRDLSKPTESTTIDVFLQELEDNKEIWWDIGARSTRAGYQLQSANRTGNQRPYGTQAAQYILGSYIRPAGQANGSQPFGNQSFREPFISQSSSFNPNRFPSQFPSQYGQQNQNRAYQTQRPWQDSYQTRNLQFPSSNQPANVNRQIQPPPGQPGNSSGYSNQNRNPGFQPGNRTTLPFRLNPNPPQGTRPPF